MRAGHHGCEVEKFRYYGEASYGLFGTGGRGRAISRNVRSIIRSNPNTLREDGWPLPQKGLETGWLM